MVWDRCDFGLTYMRRDALPQRLIQFKADALHLCPLLLVVEVDAEKHSFYKGPGHHSHCPVPWLPPNQHSFRACIQNGITKPKDSIVEKVGSTSMTSTRTLVSDGCTFAVACRMHLPRYQLHRICESPGCHGRCTVPLPRPYQLLEVICSKM